MKTREIIAQITNKSKITKLLKHITELIEIIESFDDYTEANQSQKIQLKHLAYSLQDEIKREIASDLNVMQVHYINDLESLSFEILLRNGAVVRWNPFSINGDDEEKIFILIPSPEDEEE